MALAGVGYGIQQVPAIDQQRSDARQLDSAEQIKEHFSEEGVELVAVNQGDDGVRLEPQYPADGYNIRCRVNAERDLAGPVVISGVSRDLGYSCSGSEAEREILEKVSRSLD